MVIWTKLFLFVKKEDREKESSKISKIIFLSAIIIVKLGSMAKMQIRNPI